MDSETNVKIFIEWLVSNGASFPKIRWPSDDTVASSRGAIALDDIETGEAMLSIPCKLMITPITAWDDVEVGGIFRSNKDLMKGDILLSVYLMREILKKDDSFYAPFLRILPTPGSISFWTDRLLNELQDERLKLRAFHKRDYVQELYKFNIITLNKRYPDKFPLEDYTFEAFQFAWYVIQSRAFGRRLPWSALVPFADCLNHSNVATKYDYNVDNNGVFRLFPSGANRYTRGSEVFNSYGRRANDNLLLEYGFAMADNEWDEVNVKVTVLLPDKSPREGGEAEVSGETGAMPPSPPSYLTEYVTVRLSLKQLLPVQAVHLCRSMYNLMTYNDKTASPLGSERDDSESLEDEIGVIRLLLAGLCKWVTECGTTREEDEALLRQSSASASSPVGDDGFGSVSEDRLNFQFCLHYRITRKRIVLETIRRLQRLLDVMASDITIYQTLSEEEIYSYLLALLLPDTKEINTTTGYSGSGSSSTGTAAVTEKNANSYLRSEYTSTAIDSAVEYMRKVLLLKSVSSISTTTTASRSDNNADSTETLSVIATV